MAEKDTEKRPLDEDVEAHKGSKVGKTILASEEPTDEAQDGDDDVELHGRRKHRA